MYTYSTEAVSIIQAELAYVISLYPIAFAEDKHYYDTLFRFGQVNTLPEILCTNLV